MKTNYEQIKSYIKSIEKYQIKSNGINIVINGKVIVL